MIFDRAGLKLPDTISATTMLTAFKDLISSLKNLTSGEMAKYRQALRDITKQKGFPYDVEFPTKPTEEDS